MRPLHSQVTMPSPRRDGAPPMRENVPTSPAGVSSVTGRAPRGQARSGPCSATGERSAATGRGGHWRCAMAQSPQVHGVRPDADAAAALPAEGANPAAHPSAPDPRRTSRAQRNEPAVRRRDGRGPAGPARAHRRPAAPGRGRGWDRRLRDGGAVARPHRTRLASEDRRPPTGGRRHRA